MVANSDSKTAKIVDTPTYEVKQIDTSSHRVPKPSGPNKIFTRAEAYGDWRDELIRDGYTVVKGAIPKDRIEAIGDDMMTYLETL